MALGSQKTSRMVLMTGILHWGDTVSFGRTGLEYMEQKFPLLRERAAGVHGYLPRGGRVAEEGFMV